MGFGVEGLGTVVVVGGLSALNTLRRVRRVIAAYPAIMVLPYTSSPFTQGPPTSEGTLKPGTPRIHGRGPTAASSIKHEGLEGCEVQWTRS